MFRSDVNRTNARPPVTSTSLATSSATASANPGSRGSGRPVGRYRADWVA